MRVRFHRKFRVGSKTFGFLLITAALAATAVDVWAGELLTLGEMEQVEKCFDLVPGDKIRYSYKAWEAVDFDIHFHGDGNATQYPVQKKGSFDGQGLYQVRAASNYCLTWYNPGVGKNDVRIDFNIIQK